METTVLIIILIATLIASLISIIITIDRLKYLINKKDGFERPSLNQNINYAIFLLWINSLLMGIALTIIIAI
jgi:uncharacterized membrane protein